MINIVSQPMLRAHPSMAGRITSSISRRSPAPMMTVSCLMRGKTSMVETTHESFDAQNWYSPRAMPSSTSR
jgi:hypothetical protein